MFIQFIFKGKELTFIIVEGDKFCYMVFFKDLTNQLFSDGTAGTGDQDAFFS